MGSPNADGITYRSFTSLLPPEIVPGRCQYTLAPGRYNGLTFLCAEGGAQLNEQRAVSHEQQAIGDSRPCEGRFFPRFSDIKRVSVTLATCEQRVGNETAAEAGGRIRGVVEPRGATKGAQC